MPGLSSFGNAGVVPAAPLTARGPASRPPPILPPQPHSARGAPTRRHNGQAGLADSDAGADLQPRIIDFLNLSSFSHHADSIVPIGEPLFKPTPPVVDFVDFEGLQNYDAILALRNQDSVARRVKVIPPDSSFFEVLPGRGRRKNGGGGGGSDKVAPGMEVTYIIRFKPDTQIDYAYDLVVVTEREKFTVPIRAIGGSALLELPDLVDFGLTPVKYESTKTILIRNNGDKATKILMRAAPPFSMSVVDGYLEVGAQMQLDIHFRPERAEPYEGTLRLQYGDGIEVFVKLIGAAENVHVAFSQDSLEIDDTFIALSTQNTVTLYNHSDVPVDFSWRAFPTIDEEIRQKLKLQVQLQREQEEDFAALEQAHLEDQLGTLSSDSESDTSDEGYSDDGRGSGLVDEADDGESHISDRTAARQERKMARAGEKVVGAHQRRYKNIAKAIMEDPMFFYDEIFAVEPLSGRIWAKSKATITVTFMPKAALCYECVAYCSVVGQQDRLPLLLKGQGIGPKVAFSYDELDVGDIFVESTHQYEVELINQGDIAVQFELVPNSSPFGSRFKFTPKSSKLEVGGQCKIVVDFVPDLLGKFEETFYFDLVGSTSSIPLTFRGHSVSPTFHFDTDRIAFGVVSYGFLNSKTLTLTNTSEVPMRFALRIPGDGRFAQKEFDVIPSRGLLLPSCSQKIQVDFISINVKTYDLCLVVDLDGVGQELSSIQIHARCAVPSITFEPLEVLDFGDIFLNYPSHHTFIMHNSSALPAKFQILPQEDQTKAMAEFEPDQSYGTVPAASSHVVTLTLVSRKIGPFQIPLCARILGHGQPHQGVITANSIGPIVTVDPAILDWGNANCLEPVSRQVKLTNTSVIDAQCRAFMKQKSSLWTVTPKSILLKPYESTTVTLTLTIDEVGKQQDLMYLVVTDGKDVTVGVKARGVKTPLTCREPLDKIDFGTNYTTQTITREFVVENRGRAARKVVWVPELEDGEKRKISKPITVTKTINGKVVEELVEPEPVFSVVPDSFLLDGKSACRFQFTALSSKVGEVRHNLLMQEFTGSDRKGTTVFRSELHCNFVNPLLELSETTISFKFSWEKFKPITPMTEKLTIKNISPLDVRFSTKVLPPFYTHSEVITLRPGDSMVTRIEFDPAFKVDRACGTVRQKLQIIYQDHPQRDSVNLVGQVCFPNLALSTDSLDFGSVLNSTTKHMSITISNPHELPVDYQWVFNEDQEFTMEEEPGTRNHSMMGTGMPPATPAANAASKPGTASGPSAGRDTLGSNPGSQEVTMQLQQAGDRPRAETTSSVKQARERVDVNQVFDIMPIMGRLEPGASETVHFSYFGVSNQMYTATAVCQTEGGPEYELALKGQASRLEFRIDRTELDFGEQPYNVVSEREFFLSNAGKVAYHFHINLSGLSRASVLDAVPLSGMINPDDKQKIIIKLRPGVPQDIVETALLEVAHFEPMPLTARGRGVYPRLVLSTFSPEGVLCPLQRKDEQDHEVRRGRARDALASQSQQQQRQASLPDAAAAGTVPPTPGTGRLPVLNEEGAHSSAGFASAGGTKTGAEAAATLAAAGASSAEPASAEVEEEVDRMYLCEALLAQERDFLDTRPQLTQRTSMNSSKGMSIFRQIKDLPPVTAAYFVCDFGPIVLGQTGRKIISIYNCYSEPVSFTINRKALQERGFSVLPEKVKKLPAGRAQKLEVSCFRPKEKDEGHQDFDWELPVKGGPVYLIQLMSNFVLPDLTLSSGTVEFGDVLVGRRKTIVVKLKNTKPVPVEWEYKPPADKFGKALDSSQVVFELSPRSGKLLPGENVWVNVTFTPNSAKAFIQKIALKISDNPHKKILSLRGVGHALRVEILPTSIFNLRPVLPGCGDCTQEVLLHNPTTFPIEVYSVDFDQVYTDEESMLRDFTDYDSNGVALMPVRAPGSGTWPEVVKCATKARAAREKERLRKEAEAAAAAAAAAGEAEGADGAPAPEAALAAAAEVGAEEGAEEEAEDPQEEVPEFDPAEYPFRVPTEDRLNVLIVGPPLSGKGSIAQALAKKGGRKALRLDDIVDWALAGSSPALRGAEDQARRERWQQSIADYEEAHEAKETERQAQCKKAKQEYVRQDCQRYPLPKEELVEVIQKRLALIDCNAGVVISSLQTKYTENASAAAELILAAIPEEKLLVLGVSLADALPMPSVSVAMGVGVLPAPLLQQDEGGEEARQKHAAQLKEHYAALRERLEAQLPTLAEDLKRAQDERAALGDEEPAAATAPADGEGAADAAEDAEVESPELLQLREQRNSLDLQVEALKEHQRRCEAAIARLDASVMGHESNFAAQFSEALGAVEKLAVGFNERWLARSSPKEKAGHGEKFEPPKRQDDAEASAAAAADGAEAPAAADQEAERPPVSLEMLPMPPPIALCSLGLDLEIGGAGGYFPALRQAALDVVPAPLVPEEAPLPPPSVLQLVPRPPERAPRPAQSHFSLIPFEEKEGELVPLPEGGDEDAPAPRADTRWVIEPGGQRRVLIKFFSSEIVSAETKLAFEVVGGINGGSPVSVSLRGTTALPNINSDPRNVFMRRAKNRPASGYANKQFITSLGLFDFGPLLSGRDPDVRHPPEVPEGETAPEPDPHVRQHVERLRITNNSLFQAQVNFHLASSTANAEQEDAAAAGKKGGKDAKAKGGAEAAPPKINPDFPFIVEPTSLELEVDETKEVSLFCFPTKEGTYSDTIVAQVVNNPTPIEFNICAIGAVPKVNLDTDELNFERLLVGQKASSILKIANVCAVPVRWKLQPSDAAAGVPEPFAFDALEGTIGVAEERSVAVAFSAQKTESFEFVMKLLIGDVENLAPLEETKNISVKAEAFSVDIVPVFPNEGRGLDFGEVRVGTTAEQQFQVTNNGKYSVNYEVTVRRKVIRDAVQIDLGVGDGGPAVLEPGQSKAVIVKCTPMAEMQCPDPHRRGRSVDGELDLVIREATTLEIVQLDLPPIQLSFHGMYNSYSVTPPRGLSFGPVKVGESSTREFTLYNDGIFKLDWFLFDPSSLTSGDNTTIASHRPEKGELTLGAFFVKPAEGTLEAKESAKVVVKFAASEDKDFDCRIGICVDGMPEQGRGGFSGDGDRAQQSLNATMRSVGGVGGFREYLLTGQSCTPGIDTEHVQTIFEEQYVARTLEDAILLAGRVDIKAFCEEDRFFSFGPVVVQQGAAAGAAAAGAGAGAEGGETARLRLTNPKAIPCDVKLDIKPRNAVVPTGKGEAPPALPFELSTKELRIPPGEYRYVKVRFRPTSLQSYAAVFEATVPEGGDAATNALRFELRGDGTVPTVSLVSPAVFGDSGGECRFGNLPVGRTHTIDFTLQNGGIVPATARLECKSSPHFTMACARSLPLEPKARQTFQIRFHPQEVGDLSVPLRLYTLMNPFEDSTINLVGTGFSEDVAWDLSGVSRPRAIAGDSAEAASAALPADPDDLYLGEVALGQEVTVSFHISNTSPNAMRFQFPETLPGKFADCMQISPSVGHIQPGCRKPITVRFCPKEKMKEDAVSMPASLAAITYTGEAEDWDDSMRQISDSDGDAKAGGAGKAGAAAPAGEDAELAASGDGVLPEPEHSIVEGSARELSLKVTAAADERTYVCSTDKINFAPTVMFQSKTHRFTVENTSQITLPFNWVLRAATPGGAPPATKAFNVSPQQGKIDVGATQEFSLRFAPREVENFACALECDIPHLSQEATPLRILLDAVATRPWCHFELPSSDYRSRRQSDAPIDPKYQIVELESLGTRVKNTKRFYVLNPTSQSYDFSWTREKPELQTQGGASEDVFRCMTKRGTIQSGKKYEMVFEYLPTQVGTQESAWTFQVHNRDATQSFLFVGSVKDPRIGIDRPSVNFNRLLLGATAREKVHIINKEHIPFVFSVSKASYEGEGEAVLAISPSQGVVGPGASFPIEVSFVPREEKAYNFNVVLDVKRRAQPLTLNIKGEGYKIHTKLVVVEKEQEDRVLHPGVREQLDLGSMQVQDRRKITLRLTSPGYEAAAGAADAAGDEERPGVSYNFVWQVRSSRGELLGVPTAWAPPYLSITPMQGVAAQGVETEIQVEYAPAEAHVLDGTVLRMLLPSSPGESSYSLELSGRARRPSVEFSVSNYDFGPCFVKRATSGAEPGSPAHRNFERLDILVTNRDPVDCWLSTTFQRTPTLDVQLPASMIPAGQTITVPVIFTPRDLVEYREQVDFIINDTFKSYVNLRGRGCPLNLELVTMAMQNVNFGVVVGNQPTTRSVKVVNKSQRAVTFCLVDPNNALAEKMVSWRPNGNISLRPKEQVSIELRFAPDHRIAHFTLPLRATCTHGEEVPLLSVEGTSHTAEVKLSEHSVLFGDVVYQSTVSRRVNLRNFGDLGVKFRFDLPPKLAALYSVEPSEGFAAPHDDVPLQVKFHPVRATAAERGGEANRPKKLRCTIEPDYQKEPVELIVQGRGTEQPEGAVQNLQFTTEVRERKTMEIKFPGAPIMKNPTNEVWKLNPIVSTEVPAGASYWFVAPELLVKPGEQANLEIAYRPLTMTLQEDANAAAGQEGDEANRAAVTSKKGRREPAPEKHVGKLFIATPDGNAFLFNLEGVALPPKEAKRISAEVQCKKSHVQGVEISNWLQEPQRFSVDISLIEPAEATEEIKLQGVGTFDLPKGLAKEYKFNVLAYREGTALARLVFTNTQTNEFITVEVAFKFVAPDQLQTLRFATACRQVTKQQVAVLNPLSVPVNFRCEASNEYLRVTPKEFVAPPGAESSVDVICRPLLPGTFSGTFTLRSAELGDYPYAATIEASPAGLEKTIVFKAPLGSTDSVQAFKFQHYAAKPASYTARIEPAPGHKEQPAGVFTIETKDIKAAAASEQGGVEVVVDIRFQPSMLGEVRALAVVSSPDGGDYKALLVGEASAPQPQGPFTFNAGKPGTIDFTNPFDEAVQFNVQVDNPSFVVSNRSFKLDPKKSNPISVQFSGQKAQGGRLMVTTSKVSSPWVFFLSGAV